MSSDSHNSDNRKIAIAQLCNELQVCNSTMLELTEKYVNNIFKQAISARERALCQLTVCFEFQSRSDRRKGHKNCVLIMVFRKKVTR